MDVEDRADLAASKIASAIGEPARARMLYSLLDGHARTSTELAVIAGVSPSTASVHLQRLAAERLVGVARQGRHRYFSLGGPAVARVLENLSVLAGGTRPDFVPNTPNRLRAARTCYDHMAGTVAVRLHDRFVSAGYLVRAPEGDDAYDLSARGSAALAKLGVDVTDLREMRRRLAYACLDWSERRPHIGGAVGAALLSVALRKRWATQDSDARALTITVAGRRELRERFGVTFENATRSN